MNTLTKVLAASALSICLAGFGAFAGGTAALAAPDSGTYDDQTDLAQETCWGSVSLPVAWEVGDPESAGCVHSRTASQ
ncbi:hypothetical protein [Mycolicibacterium stellerae]|uniref:hypothetical protein n=1 Tax=Mycolicibacterium stellerae TaxID=2358193 RepID=UPI000F0B8702|nr:hypothetical protein [Mycolicibacterium stellerae]